MKGNRAVLTVAILIGVLVLGWWLFRRSSGGQPIDLLTQFEAARKQPAPETFTLSEATLAGETRRAVAVSPNPGTRLTWKVQVPDDGWLRVWMGLRSDAWEQEGDGVKFLVGVSDGRAFDELFTQHVNPFHREADRRWIPVMVDLSAYSGEEVELMFNTYGSVPGAPEDIRNDHALWGAPEIVVR